MIPAFSFTGMDITVSHSLGHKTFQFRFPRSKRKRIRRKWAKDRKNWKTVYKEEIYQMGNRIICDPVSYQKIMRMVEATATGAVHGD